jgi:hypothetical protein
MVDDAPNHNLSELNGKRIAVDLSIKLYKALMDPTATRQFHASPKVLVVAVANIILKLHEKLYAKNDIVAVYVIDGDHNPLKKRTDVK